MSTPVAQDAPPSALVVSATLKVQIARAVKIEWIFSALGGYLTLLFIVVLPIVLLFLVTGSPLGLALLVVFVALVALTAGAVVAWAELAYENYWYALLREHLVVGRGVFFKSRTYIPYGRIQNVNVTRTLFDRLLGLSRLTIDTAGSYLGEGVIPGIRAPEPLVAEIMARAEEARLARARWSGSQHADVAAYEEIRLSLRELLSAAHAGAVVRGEEGRP